MAKKREIEIFGAREHNLKNIDLKIPSQSLVVFTGLSGSGKSSLAFNTIFAEGQRRYMETLSSYARQFIGEMQRPDVDKIEGLSPVVAIEQKTVNKNPRSTVGTITEVYDFLRLLYARASTAYSPLTGKPFIKYTEEQVYRLICDTFNHQKILLMSPLVKSRKGHYKELFKRLIHKGFQHVFVDGKLLQLEPDMQLDRYKTHDIYTVIDRLVPSKNEDRLKNSLALAFKDGKGSASVFTVDNQVLHHFSKDLIDPETGKSLDEPQPNTFSFNSPYGACETCQGMGFSHHFHVQDIFPDPLLSIMSGGIAPLGEYRSNFIFAQLKGLSKKLGFSLSTPVGKLESDIIDILVNGYDTEFKVSYTQFDGRKQQLYTTFKGLKSFLYDSYLEQKSETFTAWAETFMTQMVCEDCDGYRIKKTSLHFKINDLHIGQLASMSILDLQAWLGNADSGFSERQKEIGREILKEIRERVGFLTDVGLGYLSLNSPSSTLSGGEAQRIRLATQIGSKLVNVLYILDEPSIGLHQRDNERLIGALKQLRDLGNSIIVVEHDLDMIHAADYIVDIGPEAGVRGGNITAQGDPQTFMLQDSITADYVSGRKSIAIPKKRRKGTGKHLTLKGCTGHNLKNIDASFPLGTFICVTGVSGSGKSTLINETLYPILAVEKNGSKKRPLAYKKITGLEHIDKVMCIDQNPIGRTPRSNPATYTGLFTDIRQLFSSHPESLIRGYKPGRFSFNVKGGRCETCKGGGYKVIEMNFLPDVEVLCDSCRGKRYQRETLDIRYKGKNISDILNMSITESLAFFEHIPSIHRRLLMMERVGLGYIKLGQSSTTLSGGEAQRVKLSEELSKKDTGSTFYILDEPTTGLHFSDVEMLLQVLQELTDKGNTVLVIEHHLDVIKVADYIIDMGPEGGQGGGQIIAHGTPEKIVAKYVGDTARFLKMELEKKGPSTKAVKKQPKNNSFA
jgi:excinuclease ABC subunit A